MRHTGKSRNVRGHYLEAQREIEEVRLEII